MLLTTGYMQLTTGYILYATDYGAYAADYGWGGGGGGTSMYILLTIRGNRTNAGYSTQCVVLLTKNLAALAPAPVQLYRDRRPNGNVVLQ